MNTLHSRLSTGAALLCTGLLAGAFLYGWANVAATFANVPLDVHLAYRVELMKRNGTIMPILMGLAIVTLAWSTVATRGRTRALITCGAVLALTALLTTVFGNVPINGEIKRWAASAPPAGYEDRLDTWALFHDLRVAAAIGALVLLVVAVSKRSSPPRGPHAAAGSVSWGGPG
ncbi:DUF1772 domain-containing protein [Amycolatopsis cihanbeyliensis]|uniref:Putative membrane protein n=1 Tax=Amycolatopsis cihanbeyliensis TaxID=1128664 RepID=A0A542CTW6_AMYCI|nr:DUF1772 domain-containing protein [Amycolatopsis cihanbeyliensis]TQI94277.1 putative membrane protein [Amycolatopsis cihanbeyliensis]